MIKYTIYIVVLIIFMTTSCTDKLDVTPTLYQNTEDAISTTEGLESLRNSSYAYSRRVYARNFFHFAEMLADTGEITFAGTYEELRDLKNKSLVPTFHWAETSWRDAYRAINGCNLILDNLNVIEDSARRNALESDARFIRAILYFDLTRFFSLPYGTGAMDSDAIPLIISGVTNPKEVTYPSKASVEQVFDLVENDLIIASQKLPADETFFANRYSAMAMLTRLYLTVEDYTQAATYANNVIESGMFSLIDNPFYAYNQSVASSEDIFMWQQTELDNEGENNEGMAPFYASTNAVGRSEMVISESFIKSTYDSTDLRGITSKDLKSHSEVTTMFYVGFGQRTKGIYSAKWLEYNTGVTFCRLAEMYLTRAEANQMLLDGGGSQVGSSSPVNDINTILKRSEADTVGSVDINDIRFERYRELIFEGHRLHDNKRWKRNIGTISWNDDQLIIPIPKKETDTNENL